MPRTLAATETRDNGKVFTEMQGQLKTIPEYWYYYGGLADKIEGAVMPVEKADVFAFTTHEPVGVVAALTAWNSPLQFLSLKCAPALAAGCTVVVKPSEFASASSLEFAALTKEAGLPDGVFNVVNGLSATKLALRSSSTRMSRRSASPARTSQASGSTRLRPEA